ncbi:MAG: hypothetical protein HW421_2657 [Ignavibacteria bacterium]|nr:hypothetical protein [Ignavibacteria bacterium]
MKVKIFILIFFLLSTKAQSRLTLEECYQNAKNNYPLSKNFEKYNKLSNLKLRNLNHQYYPGMSLFGLVQYQSNVTKLPFKIPIPGITIPDIAKDQYKIGINVNQIIWDGGLTSTSIELERNSNILENQNNEIELFKLKQKINDAYFSILLLNKKAELLKIATSDLEAQLKLFNSRIENGVMLPSAATMLKAELLKISQSMDEIKSLMQTSLDALSILIGREIKDTEEISIPSLEKNNFDINLRKRPEYRSFDLTKSNLSIMRNLTDAKYTPKFSTFMQAAYGRPGLDMFNPDFQGFYIIGVRTSWNLWNWNVGANEKEILALRSEILDNQEKTFTINLNSVAKKYKNDIEKLGKMLAKDKEIIRLRSEILEQVKSQLDNGIITTTEYLLEFDAITNAKLNAESRQIELLKTKFDYMILAGE